MNIWQELNQVLNSGQCGILVSLLLTLIDFVQTRKSNDKNLNAESYTQWLIDNQTALVIDQLDDLKDKLKNLVEGPEIKSIINKLICHMDENKNILNEIKNETSKIDILEKKLDYLVSSFDKKESSIFKKGQIGVCSEVLNILSHGLEGAGLKTILNHSVSPENGSIMLVWLTGRKSPNMMLVDYVGSIEKNRISIILNDNNSLTQRSYDCNGKQYFINSPILPIGYQLVIFVIWEENKIQFWIDNNLIGSIEMKNGFEYIGPVFLMGIDIEGKLSADSVRWASKNKIDGSTGLNFLKDGIWHGSNLEIMLVLSQALNKTQIEKFVEDPFALFRKPEPND